MDILDKLEIRRSPAALALHWVWNQPEVAMALNGMNTMRHVVENLATADESRVGILSDHHLAIIAEARDRYRHLCPIPCTECRYCSPCPSGVFLPRVLSLYNLAVLHGQLAQARQRYFWLRRPREDITAGTCTQCRECEDLCPQQIPISEWMPRVHAVLGKGEPPARCDHGLGMRHA